MLGPVGVRGRGILLVITKDQSAKWYGHYASSRWAVDPCATITLITRGADLANAVAHFEAFLEALKKAPNETSKRELFIGLAQRGFSESELATELALSAEYQVRFRSAGVVSHVIS